MVQDDDLCLRTTEEVAKRALALIALTYRVTTDSLVRTDPDKKGRWLEVLAQLRGWIITEHIDAWLTPAERAAMAQPLGEIDDDTLFGLSWRLQALVAILWALHKIDPMPTYAESYSADELHPLMPFGRPVGEFLATVKLRVEEELVAERHRAEFWDWRGQTDMLRREGGKPPRGITFEKIISDAADTALEDQVTPDVRDGDVMCKGVLYRDLSPEAFADAAWTAQERHLALNWICGCIDDWDESPPAM